MRPFSSHAEMSAWCRSNAVGKCAVKWVNSRPLPARKVDDGLTYDGTVQTGYHDPEFAAGCWGWHWGWIS